MRSAPIVRQQRIVNPRINQPQLRNNNVVSPAIKQGPANMQPKNFSGPANKNFGGAGPGFKPAAKLQLGPGKVGPAIAPGQFKPNLPMAKLANNKFAPIFKGPKQIFIGGHWKKFLPYSALGVVALGGAYYYADGYLSLARPYCGGFTPDGCRLNWQQVGFEGGGEDWQCVQFCRRPGVLPPPQSVALVEPPPLPAQGACELTIYPDLDFAGTAVTTGEEQPNLSESGWQNQIASVQVKSGTWDFFTDEGFTGQTLRLEPGQYPTLGPDWTKRAGSFMCVQP